MLSWSRWWSPLESIGVGDCEERQCSADPDGDYHWSPLEFEIEMKDNAELIQMVITIGANWSPLELEIKKRGKAKLIQMVITIWAHWSPLKWPIVKRDNTRVRPIGPYRYRYRYGHTDIEQTNTDTYTSFQNLYQTDNDICFEIHIKPIPIPIIGI